MQIDRGNVYLKLGHIKSSHRVVKKINPKILKEPQGTARNRKEPQGLIMVPKYLRRNARRRNNPMPDLEQDEKEITVSIIVLIFDR